MRILDRYILKSVIQIFLSCIFIFLFLYVIIDLLSHLEDILKQHTSIIILTQYYLYHLPTMFVQVAPFACLLSTLYAFGKLNHANEIIAMRSSGLSILQISKTVLILGLLISLSIFWINDRFIPNSLTITQKLRREIEEGPKKARERKHDVINNLSMYGLKNRLFFVNKFSPAIDTMEGIIILEHDQHQNITRKIVANKGIYKNARWTFYQCITYNFDLNGQIIEEPIYMEEETMDLTETPRDFLNQRQRLDNMAIAQLKDYIGKLSKSGASSVIRNLKVELYQRYTTPFTSMLIILLGIPFSLRMRRKATGLSSIGLSIMVGLLYYVLDAISLALGMSGLLLPLLAVSLSHITVIIFSFYLISKLP